MKPVSALKALGEPHAPFLVVDPGKRTGLCRYEPPRGYRVEPSFIVWDCPIDELPAALYAEVYVAYPKPAFIVCEDFRLAGGNRANAGATDMPSSRGIGMCQMASYSYDAELYMAQRTVKRAGQMALDRYGREARAAARNDHQRDVVDLCGYVLRQMRLPV